MSCFVRWHRQAHKGPGLFDFHLTNLAADQAAEVTALMRKWGI